MKSLSGRFVLVTLLLQLCLSVQEVSASGKPVINTDGGSVDEKKPQFGDLLEFPNYKIGMKLYSHYGIYVGREQFKKEVKKDDDQDIFEMTRVPGGCQFSKLTRPYNIRNDYFDKDKKPQTLEQMKATIEELMTHSVKCKEYSVREENCEHVATKVRYNDAMCKQGTLARLLALLTNPRIKRQKNKQKRHEAPAAA